MRAENRPGSYAATIETTGLLPRRVGCPRRCAMPVQPVKAPEQARGDTSPEKINVTSKSQLRHISCHTDKNRYYT